MSIEELLAENARLKAEVERLTAEVSYDKRVQLHVDKLAAEFTQYEVETLKAEVERLTKLCQATSPDGFIHIRDINAAKEGKPSV